MIKGAWFILLLFLGGCGTPLQSYHASEYFVPTIHGKVDLSEEVLKELTASPPMQRLKNIRQYGACDIARPLPEGKTFTRYDHSLGVLKLVQFAKQKGASISLSQEVAALLHDCSHTAFSHSTEPFFMGGFQKGNYQDKIHGTFLKKHGLLEIAEKYGFSLEDILADHPHYTALEQPSPTLCADRLEYNLHSGYLTGLLSSRERQEILEDLHFEDHKWFFTKPEFALKLARVSLYETLHNWGSPASILAGVALSKALAILVEHKVITLEDIQYNKCDAELWEIMKASPFPQVRHYVHSLQNIEKTYKIVPRGQHTVVLKGKFSGIDPLVWVQGKMMKLTEYNPAYHKEFYTTRKHMEKGWPVQLLQPF